MYIKCKGYCFICDCPLEPYVKTDNKEKRELIRKYKKIKPIYKKLFLTSYGLERHL